MKRVALITGCGKPQGIGYATARALAANGVAVMMSDVAAGGVANEHEKGGDSNSTWRGLESAVEGIRKAGGEAAWTAGDVSAEADSRRMVQETIDRYGRLDILVNNAGAPQGQDRLDIADVPLEAWEQVMGINARGCFLMTRAAVPAMREQRWGRIVNISSACIGYPLSHLAVYSASKGAIAAFTLSMAMDVAPWGITVNAICPGSILTTRALSTARRNSGSANVEAVLAERAKHIPLGRHGRPEEIGATAAFIASEGAGFMTGQAIFVDGGSIGLPHIQTLGGKTAAEAAATGKH